MRKTESAIKLFKKLFIPENQRHFVAAGIANGCVNERVIKCSQLLVIVSIVVLQKVNGDCVSGMICIVALGVVYASKEPIPCPVNRDL